MIPQPLQNSDSIHLCKRTNTVISHCKMGGKINLESEKGRLLMEQGIVEWWTECVLFVRMDDEGRKILEIREFVNSSKAEELKRRLAGVLEG